MNTAEGGLARMKEVVDTQIVVPNQNLFRIANERTTFAEAFRMADDVLYSGVRGITDLMIMPGLINLDFADVRTIMKGMGTAMMGMGEGEGEGRALEAARSAIDNPLLDDVSMVGAKGVLINITGGYDMTLFELDEAANEIRREVDNNANIILGSTFDPELEGRIRVSVVAAGVAEQAAAVAIAPSIETPAMPDIPVVVSQPAPAATPTEPMPAPMEDIETDHRPDFRGRALPAAHVESQQGSDQVSADAAFTKPVSDSPAGFSNLFGWRREDAVGDNDSEEDKPAIVSTPDDHPKPAAFDDEDLEIPAFLRRSANT